MLTKVTKLSDKCMLVKLTIKRAALTKDAIKYTPAIKHSRAFIEWASKNSEVLM